MLDVKDFFNNRFIVTIDGPAGSGKSTITKAIAQRLSFAYLDTGSLYRALAHELMHRKRLTPEMDDLNELFPDISIELIQKESEQRVVVNGRDVTEELRSEPVSLLASRISARPEVRRFLLDIQRQAVRQKGVVAEGRDMGTVVFPDAEIKFFLDASVKERAKRRYQELMQKGLDVTYQEVENDLIVRDKQDTERSCAPLLAAADAVVIDSTFMRIDEVVESMLDVIRERRSVAG